MPSYRDKRIIEHANAKAEMALEKKKKDPELYSYIRDDFVIRIKVANDFKTEMSQLIRNSCLDIKLNSAIKSAHFIFGKSTRIYKTMVKLQLAANAIAKSRSQIKPKPVKGFVYQHNSYLFYGRCVKV